MSGQHLQNKRTFEMALRRKLETELLSGGNEKVLARLHYPLPHIVDYSSEFVYINESKNFNFLKTNQKSLDFYGLESEEELYGKNASYLESIKQKQHPNSVIKFADQVLTHVLLAKIPNPSFGKAFGGK